MTFTARHPDDTGERGSDEPAPRVLIVDDDRIVADSLRAYLIEERYDVVVMHDAPTALAAMSEAAGDGNQFHIMITDVMMPGASGLELVRNVRKRHPTIVPLVITGFGTIESAVEAIRGGAFDYLTKPIVDEELRLTLERAIRHHTLLEENSCLRHQLDEREAFSAIVGRDERMQRAMQLVQTVASSKVTVLMTGESGTGKSLIARAIHRASPRAAKPYIEMHCGSIPESLLESELFGHVKGAFTGAQANKRGRFLAAHGGTLFVDEINSASHALQTRLLRVLQDRCFEPVGSTETLHVDVRIILATNESLESLVKKGAFREDLYYRINVVSIELPPLRERSNDIPLLAAHLLEKHAAQHERQVTGFTPDALQALEKYTYPGNVRELENIVERAVVLSPTHTIDVQQLPRCVLAPHEADTPDPPPNEHDWTPMPLDKALEAPERDILLRALRANDWNRQKTADDLHINRTTLYKKMRSLGIDRMAS
ncbi:MAG: sigma-54-dependent Fis family transcriptional regulator [Phycisphaerales bacterium]|nr:sigma-54-dependent Fis family transcriptional regulator [Phycisphaerales bacterium]